MTLYKQPKQKRTADRITKEQQAICADWYALARLSADRDDTAAAKYWQDGAAAQFVKVAHRMGLLQPMMESCHYWHQRVETIEAA